MTYVLYLGGAERTGGTNENDPILVSFSFC